MCMNKNFLKKPNHIETFKSRWYPTCLPYMKCIYAFVKINRYILLKIQRNFKEWTQCTLHNDTNEKTCSNVGNWFQKSLGSINIIVHIILHSSIELMHMVFERNPNRVPCLVHHWHHWQVHQFHQLRHWWLQSLQKA